MPKRPINSRINLVFKQLNFFDGFIWFLILAGQVFNVVVVLSSLTFGGKQQILLTQSFILSMLTLYFLHRWIANAWNWLFLIFVGVLQIVFFILYKPFVLIDWNDWLLVTYLPFVLILQWFRRYKKECFDKELAIPLSHSNSVYGESVQLIDMICYLTSMFLLFGVPLLLGLILKK